MDRGPRNDAELAGVLRAEIQAADGALSDELDRNRKLALDRYYGRPRGDERKGRSKVQSLDVADMVEAVVADIAPSIVRPGLCTFSPIGEEDEKQAELETAAVEDAIFQDNDGFGELSTALKEALLLRTGWMRVEVETDEDTHTETLYGVPEDSIGLALQPESAVEEVELLSQTQTATNTDGQAVYEVRIRRTFTHEKLTVRAIQAENMLYQAEWPDRDVGMIRFIAERERIERGDLLEMGVPEVVAKDLPAAPVESQGASLARRTTSTTHAGGQEPATEQIDCYRCYIRTDMDGDGRAELWRVLFAADKVLTKEQVAFHPYVNGTAILRPFRVDGVSLYDRLEQVENVKTGTLRQWMDNLSGMNNARAGLVEGRVNLSDWYNPKPGGGVRIKDANAVVPLPIQDVGPSAGAMLEYADKMRSERGGASLDLQSAEAQIAGHTAGGTDRQYTAREKMAKMMCLTLAETLGRALYRITHRTMRTQMESEVQLKRRGEWQRTDPRRWQERSRLECNVGKSLAEKTRTAGALQAVIAFQERLIQQGMGGILTDTSKAHNALVDWCDAMDLPAAEQYWIDPTSPPAQQAAQRRAEEQQAQQQQEQQASAALLQMSLRFEKWKEEQETLRKEMELRFKYVEAALDSEATEAELVASTVTKLRSAGGEGAD